MDLLRNCIHNSHVLTGVELENGVPIGVIKKAFDEKGRAQLRTERRGLEWYCARAGIPRDTWLDAHRPAGRAEILSYRYVPGRVGDCHGGLAGNETKVRRAIDHYAAIFRGGSAESWSHGDFSLGNVVFAGDEVARIVDWENFNDAMLPEYDLVYLVTELVLFAFAGRRTGGVADAELFKSLLGEIDSKVRVSRDAARAPAMWCREQALAYASARGVDHGKCPFIAVGDETIVALDRALGQ